MWAGSESQCLGSGSGFRGVLDPDLDDYDYDNYDYGYG